MLAILSIRSISKDSDTARDIYYKYLRYSKAVGVNLNKILKDEISAYMQKVHLITQKIRLTLKI